MKSLAFFTSFAIVFLALFWGLQVRAAREFDDESSKPVLNPFSSALEILQEQIGYTFKSVGLLRRAMTHASFSEENNKALSILGFHVIETSVALSSLENDTDISSKDLTELVSGISKVESSCAVDGMRLGLHKVVRVSILTNSSIPSVVCGAFRAIFGAIGIDTRSSDDAGKVFLQVHGGGLGTALAM